MSELVEHGINSTAVQRHGSDKAKELSGACRSAAARRRREDGEEQRIAPARLDYSVEDREETQNAEDA